MRLLLAILSFISIAHADAPSLLGLCHPQFDCKHVNRLYHGKSQVVAGWIENTFGTECKCADTLLQDDRPKVVRIHLANGPCMRNRRCGPYEVFYGYNAASAGREFAQKRGKAVRKFQRVLARAKKRLDSAKAPLQCLVSPCLECDLNAAARRGMFELIRDTMPGCTLVDNPFRQRCIKGTICEKHGDKITVKAPCIADLDGTNGATIDLAKWAESVKHCQIRFYWEPWMNCINGEFIDPRKRICRYAKSVFDFTRETICQYFYPSSAIC